MDQRDFFISYNKADRDWATWIADTLENAGYTTVLEAWDFRPGANFAVEMQQALTRSDRVVAVLSPDYFNGPYALSEWASAFGDDPTGAKRRLVPVMVRECAPPGLLSAIIHIRLVGLDVSGARTRLLGGLSAARAKPLTGTAFPGARTDAVVPTVSEPPREAVAWAALDTAVPVLWRVDATGSAQAAGPLLEAHLVPVPATKPLPVRELGALGDRLMSTGRATGVFTQAQAVTTKSGTGHVTAYTGGHHVEHGLLATRTGQRGGWVPLPSDPLGAVLDEADIATRLLGLLTTLVSIDWTPPQDVALAVGAEPAELLVDGDAAEVGRRTSARLNTTGQRRHVRWAPTDTVPFAQLGSHGEEIAAELAARVMRAFAEPD